MLGFCTNNEHDLRAVECRKDIRLILFSKLVLKRDPCEENSQSISCQFIIDLLGNNTVLRSPSHVIRLFVANENIKGLFL